MKNSTNYLYDINPEELIGMEYYQALKYKLDQGRFLRHRIYTSLSDQHLDRVRAKELEDRRHWVEKAIRHTENLISEVEA